MAKAPRIADVRIAGVSTSLTKRSEFNSYIMNNGGTVEPLVKELEARAARTIAERGVQLIGTAHGNALENLMLNPVLSDLIGGIESVTLSDEEAKRRWQAEFLVRSDVPIGYLDIIGVATPATATRINERARG